jgi:hypothetical protein
MTAAAPLARYGDMEGALRERLRYQPATPLSGTRPTRLGKMHPFTAFCTAYTFRNDQSFAILMRVRRLTRA